LCRSYLNTWLTLNFLIDNAVFFVILQVVTVINLVLSGLYMEMLLYYLVYMIRETIMYAV